MLPSQRCTRKDALWYTIDMTFLVTFMLKVAAIAAAIVLTITYVPGITISGGYVTLAIVALMWTAIITVIRPVLKLVALPFSILTFGLSSVIINAGLFWIMTQVIPGFTVDGILPVLFGSFILAACTWVITLVL
jgi:putative membrane protein